MKKIFKTVKNFRAHAVFQGEGKLLKTSECKSILNTVKNFRHLCFSGQSQVVQKSWMVKNMFNTVKNFTANSVFQEKVKKFPIQYIQSRRTLVKENTTQKELHPLELASKVTTECAYTGTPRTGLPNLFSTTGHFHMKKFIAGHKRFCDVTISYCDVTNPWIFISFTR